MNRNELIGELLIDFREIIGTMGEKQINLMILMYSLEDNEILALKEQ